MPVSAIMRSDVPTVHVDTRLPEVFQAVVSTRLHRAVVVDSRKRVLGVISDAELLQRVTPALHPSAIRSLMQRLAFVHSSSDEQHASARQAGDLMTDKLAIVSPDTPLHDVIDTAVSGAHKLVVVVDKDRRLLGAVDRADLLGGLQTSKYQVRTSASPYRSFQCVTKARMRPSHFRGSFGFVTFPLHQKIVLVPLASAPGQKPSSTNGFMWMRRRL